MKKRDNKYNFKISAIAAIISAILFLPAFIIGIFLVLQPNNPNIRIFEIIISVIGVLLGLVVIYGYIKISEYEKNYFLRVMCFILIPLLIISTIITLFFKGYLVVLYIFIVIYGVIEILFGSALIKLKKTYGGIALSLGIIYIVNGAFYSSILLFFLTFFTSLTTTILEIILFFKAAKKY